MQYDAIRIQNKQNSSALYMVFVLRAAIRRKKKAQVLLIFTWQTFSSFRRHQLSGPRIYTLVILRGLDLGAK